MQYSADAIKIRMKLGWLVFLLLTSTNVLRAAGAEIRKGNETDRLVRYLTEKFNDADKKSVIVMDLEPAFGPTSAFGPWLADQISTSLDQGAQVQVIDRRRLESALDYQHLVSKDEFELKNAMLLGKYLGASAVVVGSYGAAKNGLGLTLAAFRTSESGEDQSNGLLIGMVFGKIPFTNDLGSHLGAPIESLRPKDNIYRSGYGGVSIPHCITCTAPSMSSPDVDIPSVPTFLRPF